MVSSEKIGRVAIIGAGAMGTAFAGGMISAGLVKMSDVVMSDLDETRLATVSEQLGVQTTNDNLEAIRGAQVVLVAVKPVIVKQVMNEIGEKVSNAQLLVSIAAGVKLDSIESSLSVGVGVVRAMPNTPCLIGSGVIGFCRGKSVTDEQVEMVKQIFDAVGISAEVPEKLMDAVTGVSGSGPAYIYLAIEALSDAGVRVGLPRDIALKFASQTVLGAAKMVVETGEHPAKLKDQVTSPGGTTIAALDALEQTGLRSAFFEAVKAATKRSEELA